MRVAFLASALLVACSEATPPSEAGKQVRLPACWDGLAFHRGDRISGRATALFSPDGPLLIRDVDCGRAQFIAEFENRQFERRVLDDMGRRSRGQWYGGQAYLVDLSGSVGDRVADSDGLGLTISDFTIVQSISGSR